MKSKFPGKPSKLAQRQLVSSYSAENVYETSTDAFDGLSYFERLFATDDNDSSVTEFAGFHCFDVSASYQRRERLLNDLQTKFPNRTPSALSSNKRSVVATVEKSPVSLPPPSPESDLEDHDIVDECPSPIELSASSIPQSHQYRKRTKMRPLNQRVFNRYRGGKLQIRHNFKTLSKNSIVRFKHKSSSNYLSDRYCRKFLLPSRSIHSSRIIKPNKRFVEAENGCKHSRLGDCKDAEEEDDSREIDYEKKSPTIVSSGKVIIREARLNIVTETAIAGPFSTKKNTNEKDKLKYGGGTTCGICGANRHHKHFFHTKKFGVFSCDLCRRFILKMIKQSKQSPYNVIRCRAENEAGQCDISSTTAIHKMIVNEETTSFKNARCQACWLTMCLQRYTLPSVIRKSLSRLLPEKLKTFCTMFACANTSKLLRQHETEYNFKTNESNEENDDPLKNRLRTTVSQNQSPKTIISNENATSAKKKWILENNCAEPSEKSHHVVRGPRIKHVCRSASAVLKTSPVAAKGQEAEDSNSCSAATISNQYPHREIEKYATNKGRLSESDHDSEGSSQRYGARSLQDFYKNANAETDDSDDKMVSIDFWEAYDPDEIFQTGFPLISTETVNVRALCFLCGSTGLEKLLYCVCCCEPYHWYCAEGPSAFRDENELEKCRLNWVCRKCKVCSRCGERSSRTLLSCQRCKLSYHSECLNADELNKRLFKSDRPWVCPTCLKCKSCNAASVSTYVGNVPLCGECFKLRQKGNYCPLCQGCYQDEDYNVQMMECGVCKSWIHAKCEGVSYEKYQILSFLPETIEFVCRLCCTTPPAQWWLAVENELTSGYLVILKCLCKNCKIADLLKESPRKTDCECGSGGGGGELSTANEPARVSVAAGVDTSRVRRALIVDDDAKSGDAVEYAAPAAVEAATSSRCECADDDAVGGGDRIGRKLLAVKAKVRNNEYASLGAFHAELEDVIRRFDDARTLETYREILRQYFPWFDAERAAKAGPPDARQPAASTADGGGGSCAARKSGRASTNGAAEAADDDDDDEPTAPAGEASAYETLRRLHARDEYRYEHFRALDARACNFCKRTGEATCAEGGRLIYCGRNEWVHSNCALWSSEVFEEIDGSLQNVHSAVSRGRQIRCTLCEKKGASVGCCYKNCGSTYHFACARKHRCWFFQNKTMYCAAHDATAVAQPLLTEEKDFEILRPVYVETDRKKKKYEWHGNVRLRIGSLHVESLGKIDPHLSDHPRRIVPIAFRCTRLFWSTVTPWKLVQYKIEIRLRYTYETVRQDEREANRTTAHEQRDEAAPPPPPPQQGAATTTNDLLIPELQGDDYTDLPKDFLNDTTLLHDIWNNYDRAQEAAAEAKTPSNAWRKRTERENEWQRKKTKRRKQLLKAFLNGCPVARPAADHCLRDRNEPLADEADDERSTAAAKRKMPCESGGATTSGKRVKFGDEARPGEETIAQLDGMVDVFGDEEPVSCVQCHRTYRTSVSYERHLETCADFNEYMNSSDESCGSEDEKCAEVAFAAAPKVVDVAPMTIAGVAAAAAPQLIGYSIAAGPPVADVAAVLQNVNPEPLTTTALPAATIKLNVDVPTTPSFAMANLCDAAAFRIQNVPQASIAANANGTAYVIHSFPKPEVIPTFVAVNGGGYDAIPPAETFIPQPMQLQQVTTGFNDAAAVNFQPMVPTLLGGIVQPNMTVETPTYILNATPTPAALTTASAHTAAAAAAAAAELFAPQNIVLPNQSLLFGLETVVSNTVMSSSQFVAAAPSALGAALESSTMYSTTTTQYFQAAKPILPAANYSSGYVVLNGATAAAAVPQPSLQPALPQTMPTITSTHVHHHHQQHQQQQTMTVCQQPAEQPVEKYMYVRIDSVSSHREKKSGAGGPANGKQRPVIIKPAVPKVNNAAKPVKVMKVKNNRPVGIEVKTPTTTTTSTTKCGKNVAKVCPPLLKLASATPVQSAKAKVTPPSPTTAKIPLLSPVSIDVIPPLSPIAHEQPKVEATPASDKPSAARERDAAVAEPPPAAENDASADKGKIESNLLSSPRESDDCKTLDAAASDDRKAPTPESYLKISSIDDEAAASKRGTGDIVFDPLRGRRANDERPSSLSMPLLVDVGERAAPRSLPSPGLKTWSKRKYQPRVQPRSSQVPRKADEDASATVAGKSTESDEHAAAKVATPTPAVETGQGAASESPVAAPAERAESPPPPPPPVTTPAASSGDGKPPLARKSTTAAPVKSSETPTVEKWSPMRPVVNGVLKAAKKATAAAAAPPKSSASSTSKTWKTASVSFEVNAEDGFSYKTNDLSDLWSKILESVQRSRRKYNLPLLPKHTLVDPESVYNLLGFDNNASKYLLEQLPDAWKCIFYKPKFHKTTRDDDDDKSGAKTTQTLVESKSGCARTEPFARSHKYDMFGWLASRHRKPPKFIIVSDSDIVNGNRRVTSLNLPMAMRFRHLKETAKETVGVFQSDIHGRGLFCLRDIDPGEMVIEYAGEVIRSTLTDKREKYYTSKGIGCYMFRIDDRFVVDATMSGNAARFINHSCEPNCYSRIVDILGKKHILIFALRRIPRGEELTYDYKFPLEDEKIYCHCLSRKCRKYLN